MDRTPLVLLPGMPLDGALWEHQIRHLADVAEISVGDVSGHDSVAGLARSVLDAAPDRFALAGLSLGGYVAMEVMRQAPDRVAKLALMATSARPDTPEQTSARRAAIELAKRGRLAEVVDAMIARLLPGDRLGDRDLVSSIGAQAERVGLEGYARQQTAIIGRPDSRPSLPAIACPTLVVGGRQDILTPPALLAEIAAAIPGAELIIVEECGHLAPMERPRAMTALLRRWLSYA